MSNNRRSLSEIETELEENRNKIDRTLDSLQTRFSAENLMERARGYTRATGGQEFVHNLQHSVRRNPLPVAVTGAGLIWLMTMSSDSARQGIARNTPDRNSGSGDGEGLGEKASRARNRLGAKASRAGDKVSRTGDDIGGKASNASARAKNSARGFREGVGSTATAGRERISDASHRARHGASRMSEGAQRGASRMSEGAQRGASRVAGGVDYMRREQPLMSAAFGLAIGVAIAASLPRSKSEDRAMGSTSDELGASAREAGHEKIGQARSVAESAAHAASDAAKSEAERQRHGDNDDV